MRETIIGNYYDILKYSGSGGYGKLIRHFRASLLNFNVSLEKKSLNKYRQRASFFLNTIGLLELDIEKQNNFSWSICQGFLVSLESSRVRCIGGTTLVDQFISTVGEDRVTFHDSGYQPLDLPEGVVLFPQFPEVTVSDTNAKQLASKLGCRFIESPAKDIVRLLPPIVKITPDFHHRVEGLPDDPLLEGFFFHEADNAWQPIQRDIQSSPRFMRRSRIDGRFDYFVVRPEKHGVAILRIESVEWAYLIAYDLLNEKILCKYDDRQQIFSVPRFLRLPLLIERVLVAGSFSVPSFMKKRIRQYGGVSEDVVRTLQEKYPVLNIVRDA
ncbi:hypothetical protein ACFL2V_10135 [Pseudomonadota bacterium]